jgi:hypothetical protein
VGAQRRDLLAVPGLACEQNTPPHADGLAQPCVLAPVRSLASAIGSFAFLPGTTHALGACVLNVDFAAAGDTGAVPSRGAPHLPGSPGTPEREQAGVLFVRGRAIGMRVEELRKPWIQHVLRFLFAPARRPAGG